MKKQAVIRVDGGPAIGLGHLVRCLNFAKVLRHYNVSSLFVTKGSGNNALDLIRRQRFGLKLIDKKVNFRSDALLTKKIAISSKARFILTDLGTEENLAQRKEFCKFFRTLRPAGLPVISIDDFIKINFPFDIQIVPYCGAEDMAYKFSKNTTPLLGPRFYIAAPQDVKLAQGKRVIRKVAKRILVTIGGSDPTLLTLDIAKALIKLNRKELCVKFIIGSCFSDEIKEGIKDILKNFKGTYELCPPKNIIKQMLWSDLVVSGIGLTRYEAALTGTPNICVTRARLNAFRIRKFIAAGTSRHFSITDETSLPQAIDAIEQLLENQTIRKEMSQSGKKLVDGQGANRIAAELRKRKII